ncbi:unnamed protein product [Prunus armeniaca]|uniref:GAG-pre-integrase domain-containing protein n=1 Tax=Prunus armeniaca TaxID=36596 RepID=A0A6J5TL69_PRUAR|nr:unnamed protein product [Prunus armeniaca]
MASPSDTNWYLDSGATHHMTTDACSMPPHSPPRHNDQVIVGNGESLHKQLLYIAKFTRGNLGPCEDGLYPIPPVLASIIFTGSKFALAYLFASSSLWHHRLGHPSNHVLRIFRVMGEENLIYFINFVLEKNASIVINLKWVALYFS